MGLQHRAWAGAVDHARNARLAIQARIGVERRAHGRDGLAKNLLAVFLNRFHQGLGAWQRLQGARQKKAFDPGGDARETGGRVGNHLADGRFDLRRIFFRDHAAVQFEADLSRHHVGMRAAFDAAHVEVGVPDAFDA